MSKASDRLEAAAALAAQLAIEARDSGSQTWPAHMVARHVVEIMRIARRMDNLALRQCNEPWGDAEYEKAEKARARALEKIKEIGAHYAIKGASVHGDPRGFVVRLELQSGKQNGWGDGWGVLGA